MKCKKCNRVFVTNGSEDENVPDELLIEDFACYDCLGEDLLNEESKKSRN